ncbi:MAG: GxxExxY protein [Pirellulaceae bacterium]|nr:GxxExxY protein [Pirellulaceae bacterium]
MNASKLNALSYRVIGAAIAVHRELGPGLEESDYEMALSAELTASAIPFQSQQPIPVVYKGVHLEAGFRVDVFVDRALVVELKAVDSLHPVHEAQLLTYLRLSYRQLGLLINFDVPVLKDGVLRRVMGLVEDGVQVVPAQPIVEPFSLEAVSDDLTFDVIQAAIEVHRHLGPGLLQSVYHECLCYELSLRRLPFQRKACVPLRFRDVALPKPVEIDVVVAGELPLSIVSVAGITPLLEARLLGRLRNGCWRQGLLLNFSEKTLGAGVRRIVNPNLR